MAKKNAYNDYLKQTLGGLIDKLDVSDLRKEFLKNRWLDQVMWLEGRATKERNQHFRLRMITIVGGVLVPAMVGFRNPANQNLERTITTAAFIVSQAVAISAAVEEFFGHGDKYRNYRSTAESMKIEGWQFMQLAGPYRKFKIHEDAYKTFAQRVEQFIQKDVEGFVARLEEKQEEDKEDAEEAANNAEKALMRLNQELEEQAQRLEFEKARLAEQQASQQPAPVDSTYSGELLDIQMPPAESESSEDSAAVSEDLTGVQSFMSPPKSTSARRSPRPASTSTKTIKSSSSLPPLGQHALEWEEKVDFQALKTILTEQNSVLESGTQTNGGSTAAGPQLITPDEVSQVLECSLEDCKVYLPGILTAMKKYDISDKSVLIGLLATIRIETGGFKPVHEWGGESYWKRYEDRADLGNVKPGDGVKYHGRGYIQLTGRANYKTYGEKLGVDLEGNPDLAMDPEVSAQVLACYFKERSVATAARDGDWRRVRKLVNGGYHGWDVFSKYVERAQARLA
ncbi:MAG: DUF4231 domain-containing protein [Cyanobacteria bacterium P01_F01_bin.13]